MRNLGKLLLVFLLVISLSPNILISRVLAQEPTPAFDFNKAYQDYLYNYNLYRQTHDDYVVARQSYLNYQTLTSKTEAQIKTLAMLGQRNLVIGTYLTALRLKLLETTGIKNYQQSQLFLKLEEEINWYKKNSEELGSAGSLEDLLETATKTQPRYKSTQSLMYQTLGMVLIGKETSLQERQNQVLQSLKGKIAEIRVNNQDTSKFERWSLEAEKRLTRASDKQNLAQTNLLKTKSSQANLSSDYQACQLLIKEAHQYLKEANFNLKELISEIKYDE